MLFAPILDKDGPVSANITNLPDFGEASDLPYICQPIAGLQYYDFNKLDELIGWIRPTRGDRLQLVRRPANPYDENAVEVHWRNGQFHLGHLPREIARVVAPLLDEGRTVRCYAMNSGNENAWSLWALLVAECLPTEASKH